MSTKPKPYPRGAAAALTLLLAATGCQAINAPLYFKGTNLLDTDNAMPMPGMQAEVTDGVSLRFRNPTAQERKDLDARQQALGFDVPWIAREHVHVEVLFTVRNLDSDPGVFNVMVNGANEWLKYDQAAVAALLAANKQKVSLPLMQSRPQMLAAGGKYEGLLREDDFAEAESDLDAIDKWMAPFAAVLINRSDVNPIGMDMVPASVVVPAMIEVDMTFTADKHMTCEYLVRVRDDNDQLLHDAGDTLFAPNPPVFAPMLPPKT